MTRPTLILAALVLAAACGTRKTQTRDDGTGPTSAARDKDKDKDKEDAPEQARPIKQVLLAWSLEPTSSGPIKTKVALAVTDEMGRVTNHPIAELDGTCTDVGPIELYRADTALTCGQAGKGVQLHAVAGRGEVLVFEMDIAEGTEPDPMARRQIARVEVSVDAKISVAP